MRDFPLGKGSVRWSRLLPLATGLAVMTAGSAALACPDWQQTGQQIRYSADQLWSPQSLSVVAGGASNLANCPQPGVGYVAARPDFDLTPTDNGARRDLVIRVTASCDAVLLVNGADGQWSFNDDSDGVNPRLQLSNMTRPVVTRCCRTSGLTPPAAWCRSCARSARAGRCPGAGDRRAHQRQLCPPGRQFPRHRERDAQQPAGRSCTCGPLGRTEVTQGRAGGNPGPFQWKSRLGNSALA